MLSRKYYEEFAKILGNTDANSLVVLKIVGFLEKDNPRFDREKFLIAVSRAKRADVI